MIEDNLYFRWFSKHWIEITDRLKNSNVDWNKWKITPAPEGRRNVHK